VRRKAGKKEEREKKENEM